MKWLIILFLILGGFAFLMGGYRLHPENFKYYTKFEPSSTKQDITFTDGRVIHASVIEETQDTLKIDMDGARMTFKRSEVQTIKTAPLEHPLAVWKRNYDQESKLHPLLTNNKEDTAGAAWDRFAMEPSRIADEMKRKHPEISATASLEKAQAEAAKARLAAYKQRTAMEKETVGAQ